MKTHMKSKCRLSKEELKHLDEACLPLLFDIMDPADPDEIPGEEDPRLKELLEGVGVKYDQAFWTVAMLSQFIRERVAKMEKAERRRLRRQNGLWPVEKAPGERRIGR